LPEGYKRDKDGKLLDAQGHFVSKEKEEELLAEPQETLGQKAKSWIGEKTGVSEIQKGRQKFALDKKIKNSQEKLKNAKAAKERAIEGSPEANQA
jgi:hypothetical protein